jgi:hypothetical protein
MTPAQASHAAQMDLTDDWRRFAKIMFALEDADPGYMLLHRAVMPRAQKLRYVLAWCTFYNPGLAAVACRLQGADFYAALRGMYPTAKRASERRHFRGKAGLLALAQWEARYPKPEAMVDACFADTYLGVRANMKDMAQMGDYFYWKLADIQDTVFSTHVDFTDCAKYMPKVPKQGAEIISELESTCHVLEHTMDKITQHIEPMHYPIKGDRTLALQEAETVCCIFKQHVKGDYMFGFRSAKAEKRLQSMQAEAPKEVKVLLDGLYAGGIWTPATLSAVSQHM